MNPTRREALQRLGAAGAAGLVATGGGLWLHDRDRRGGSQIGTLPDFQVTRSSSYAQLGIGSGGTAAANTRAAIAALGGMDTFINSGEHCDMGCDSGCQRRT